jgi:Mlc titration factor MtfA (ptsG expression regulator)
LISVNQVPDVLRALQRWWRGRRPAEPAISEAQWQTLCAGLSLLRHYDAAQRRTLRRLSEEFLQRKRVVGAGGLEVTAEMRLAVAVQACVPVLGLGLDWYDDWTTVILYPAEFMAEHVYEDEHGVVHHERRPLAGEASEFGPVALSWEDAHDAVADCEVNVVIHEFAHKLDMRNGVANGMPPLHRNMDRQAWTAALQAAYDDFCQRFDHGLALPFDDYAEQDPAEFFAVASEAFFLTPERLASAYPQVYQQFGLFYRQWPGGPP